MQAIKFLIFVAVAIACVFAAEERVKKDVLIGAAPYPYSGLYSGAYSPYAYAGYAGPAAIHSTYSTYPYSNGFLAPAAYRSGLYY